MKKNQNLAGICLMLIFMGLMSTTLQAQIDFNLADYKNPDYRWRALDFQLDLNGFNTISHHEYREGDKTKDLRNNFIGNMNASYHAIKNSSNFQGEQRYSLSFGAKSSKTTKTFESPNSENIQKNYSQALLADVYSANRFYNRRKQFFAIDIRFVGLLNNDLRKYSEDTKSYPFKNKYQSKEYQVEVDIPLLVGIGRIEEVQDARLAVYILDDLQRAGDLARDPDNEDVMAFATFITETKNQRFFDSRIRKIEEITAVDSFLIVRGLKGKSDASYYTLLNDNWDNASGPQRSTGRRFSMGLVPNLSADKNKYWYYYQDTLDGSIIETMNNGDIQKNSKGLDVVAYYACEKPINLYWQQSVVAQLRYEMLQQTNTNKYVEDGVVTTDSKETINSPGANISAYYSLGYFPNSRTSLKLTAGGRAFKNWEEQNIDEQKYKTEITFLSAELSLNCYYYFSPQLRFSLNVSESYNNSAYKYDEEVPGFVDNSSDTSFRSYFLASFTYSIF